MNNSNNNLETELTTNNNAKNSLDLSTNQVVKNEFNNNTIESIQTLEPVNNESLNESNENGQNIKPSFNYETQNQFNNTNFENTQSLINFNKPEEEKFQDPKKNMSKKNICIIIVVISAIIVGVASIIFITSISKNNEQGKNVKELFSDSTPILVKKNNKYGYINSKGKEITEIKYESAKDFVGNYGVVSYDKKINDYTQEIYQLIDKNGKEVLNKDITDKPEYIEDCGVWLVDDVIYNNKLKAITDEDMSIVFYEGYGMFYYVNHIKKEAGVVDYTGKIRFKLENTESLAVDISSSDDTLKDELYASVASGNKDYIVDLNKGKIIHEISGNDLLQLAFDNNIFTISDIYNTESVTCIYVSDGKVAYKSSEIKFLELINPEKNILKIDYGYNYADKGLTKQYKYYYVNENKYLETAPNEDLNYSSDKTEDNYGIAGCIINGSHFYGLKKGDKDILECKYNGISLLDEEIREYIQNEKKQDLVIVEDDTNTILLDLNTKKEIIKLPGYHYKSATENTSFIATINNGKTYTYNIISGKQIEFAINNSIEYKTNHIIVDEGNKKTYYNQDLQAIYTIEK